MSVHRVGVVLVIVSVALAAAVGLYARAAIPRASPLPGSGHGDGMTGAGTRHAPADVSASARLRLQDEGGMTLAIVDNLLGGPVEAMLHPRRGARVSAAPALPARASVPARGSVLVSRLQADDAGALRGLWLQVVPGDPNARPRDLEYGFPLQARTLRIEQGFGGRYSHATDQTRHAVDFAAPVGTPVLAARDGVVMQLESGFVEGGADAARYGERANFVRIVHDDGSMALYAHLDAGTPMVRVGEQVRRGQRIGASGNTGFSNGPHLHFAVQVNRGMRLQTVPFRMFGPHGILRFDDPAAAAPRAGR